MTPVTASRLPPWRRTTIIQGRVKYPKIIELGIVHLGIIALCLLAHGALAQEQTESKPGTRPVARENAPRRDDLDVTMQIIVDPDAKLPDEVVRRIPLPERKSAAPSPAAGQSNAADAPDKERAREAKELGREVGQSAKERAKEAAEQREQARRAEAEERRRQRDERDRDQPPGNPPGRPPRDR